MYFWALALLTASGLFAASDSQLALDLKAQTDFDRVELAAVPRLQDAAACVQSQAALLAVAPRAEGPLIHYRKGYCALVGAALSRNSAAFSEAAAEFDRAIAAWPDRLLPGAKNRPAEPVSSALRVLAWIARLEAGAGADAMEQAHNDMAVAIEARACPSSLMPATFCEAVLRTGRQWLGWISLQRGDLYQAATELSGDPGSPWSAWVAGKQAFGSRQYARAAAEYGRAVEAWRRAREEPAPALASRLAPQPHMARVLADWGGAQLLAGDPPAAIATLSLAARADPSDARTLYLRGRAKEQAGQTEAAAADYNLASRTAFAAADRPSGEAHLYRGVMLYLRKDYDRAEDAFSSALNFGVPPGLQPDAEAWRSLAAVAGGACGASRERLERAIETASPYFPKDEARAKAASCSAPTAAAPSPQAVK